MATGSLALALLGAEAMIAASAAFQARVGAADETEALESIVREQSVDPQEEAGATLAAERPFCLLSAETHGYIQIGQGQQIWLGATGGIYALFVDNPSETAETFKASHDDFLDWVSTVIDQVAALSGQGDYFPFNGLDLVLQPTRSQFVDRAADDFWMAAYVFNYSINN